MRPVEAWHRLARRVDHPRARGERDDDSAPFELRVVAEQSVAGCVAHADEQVRSGQREPVRDAQQQSLAPRVVQRSVDDQHVVDGQD